jgi:4-coumarate--CoA ligase
VGAIVASTEVKIVDPTTDKECGLNEEGEIWAREPLVVMGYLSNEKVTGDAFDLEGILHTGDIGRIDEEGLISITEPK